MLNGGGLSRYMTSDSDDGEDDLDEQDLQDDPIWQLDLSVRPAPSPPLALLRFLSLNRPKLTNVNATQAHLNAFFRQAYEHDQSSFRQIAETFLNGEEKTVLTHFLSSA